ncbi:MAG: hypothetical protein CMK00_08955 [Planctomycetes bacterium]|nr:hypothetical protein [Planctomycetota bacterium]HJO26679.1 hypothetical protein [Planctomycetota bacterium]
MRRLPLTILLATLAVCHALSFAGSGPFDDDFILYRYARNLVEGQGPVFQPGERVEGFTSPLTVLLLAWGLRLGLAARTASLLISILGTVLAVCSVDLLWHRARLQTRFPLPALLLALSPAFAWHAIAGQGTTLVAGLLATALFFHDRALRLRAPAGAAALCLGLAALARPEALLFVPPFVLMEQRRPGARPVSQAALALAPTLAWGIFRYSYYGSVLPITWSLKKLPLFTDLAYGLRYLALGTLETGFLIALALALPQLRRFQTGAPDRTPAFAAAAAGLLLHTLFVAYSGGDFIPLGRFLMPVLPLALFLACLSAARLPLKPSGAALLVLIALAAPQWVQSRRHELYERHRVEEGRWSQLGAVLGGRLAPDMKVALAPIGAFGFYSGLPIVDLLGRTNTVVRRAAPDLTISMKGHHRFDADFVLAEQPAMIILGNGRTGAVDGAPGSGSGGEAGSGLLVVSAWERTLFEHPLFKRDYEPRVCAIPDGPPLIFFWRRELPAPSWARAIVQNG